MSRPLRRALAALVLLASAGAAQEPAEPAWSAAVHHSALQVAPSPDRAFWHTTTLVGTRRTSAGSYSLQGVLSQRYERTDRAGAIDVYHDLWTGAYGHARLQYSPDAAVLPTYQAEAEVFQAVGGGDVSAGYRHQRYDDAEVATVALGVGYYAGQWYLRQRSQAGHVHGDWSTFFTGMARRYLDDAADDYVDISLGLGHEVLEVAATGPGAAIGVSTSPAQFAAVRLQRYLMPSVAVLVGVSYSRYDRIPDRWGVSLGTSTRW